jgi:hypothetical protein
MSEKRDVDISASFSVSKQFLSDILTDIVENTPEILAWFGDFNDEVVRIEDVIGDKTWLDPLSVVRIVGRYDHKDYREGNRIKKTTLDLASIQIGVSRALMYKNLRSDIRGRILEAVIEDSAGPIDSEAGDIIAQLAVYGEIVYG